ncbi:AI-2E family transporter [Sphaerimonospora thailandensis]|uniref:AI-2E family transporter n=1 Tax=Sphaerimonospora thailandensis TaxID=795644 RepID=A0A8J3R8L3_9ACTN|nr:AI-2E family transporter [Sphaerimonospora thailandensis]GIH69399.1 AI-2E family transporter [Sphaerimonospora thailandensis]
MISHKRREAEGVPPVLATLAAWSWRLLLIGALIYVLALIIGRLNFVVLPLAVAFLLTALLHPLTRRLRTAGLRPIYATWITMLLGLAVIVGVGFMIGARANEEFPRLVEQIQLTARSVQDWLLHGPLHLKEAQLADIVDELGKQINERRTEITGTVLSGATAVVEVLASIVLILFVTFFLLKDGDRIWSWFLRAFGRATPRVDRAGRAAWVTISQYVHGTVAVAAIHGFIIGVVLAGMQVPLWAPLAVLIFFASFIPVVGIFFAGGIATLVTFGSQGWVYALIFVGILVVEQQLENHVLQPFIVGRALAFHPLAIILVLAVGGVLGGIAGAVVAVPLTAVIYRALPELRRDPEAPIAEPPDSAAPPARPLVVPHTVPHSEPYSEPHSDQEKSAVPPATSEAAEETERVTPQGKGQ